MGLSKESIKRYLLTLPEQEQTEFIVELNGLISLSKKPKSRLSRRRYLNNKQGSCPHCWHSKYVKYGIDKGSQRYKCKSCKRNFTEYTGTWMAGIHKKDKIDEYLV